MQADTLQRYARDQTVREEYAEITPGYHMTDLLIVENLPRAKRPVDPATFGRSEQ